MARKAKKRSVVLSQEEAEKEIKSKAKAAYSFRFEKGLIETLDEYCSDKGFTRTEVIEYCLRKFLREDKK